MTRLLIAEDSPLFLAGLERIAEKATDIRIAGIARSPEEALELAGNRVGDVFLLDSQLSAGILELVKSIVELQSGPAVVVLCREGEGGGAVRFLRAGAASYLTQDEIPDHLVPAIRRAAGGGRYVSQKQAEYLALYLAESDDAVAHERLSDREFQVLCGLGGGKLVKEIAAELGISPKTVSTYRVRILRKLVLDSTADLVRYVVEHRLDQI